MSEWILTFIILSPMIAAIICLLIPANGLAYRCVALLGAGLTLPASIWICLNYDRTRAGFQVQQHVPWVPSLGIGYHVGADGTSVVLILLTAIIITGGVFASWTHKNRTKEFLALLLLLVSGVFGVFASRDLFFLFLFYEIAVLP